MMRKYQQKQIFNNRGFTLVEVIVVLVILAILIAILAPSLVGYIQKGSDVSAKAECRQAVTAAQTVYSEQYASGNILYKKLPSTAIMDEITALSEVPGTINRSIETDQGNTVIHLLYTTTGGQSVVFCRNYASCTMAGHKENYNMLDTLNTELGFYITTESGRMVEMTTLGNFGDFQPDGRYGLESTYWYYEGDENFPAGYYAFRNTKNSSNINKNFDPAAKMQQINGWNDVIMINVDKEVKTYQGGSKDFNNQLRVGDICEFTVNGETLLAVFAPSGSKYGSPSPSWRAEERNKTVDPRDQYGVWIVIDETSKALTPM